jgi:hypothetical protein
MIKTFCPEHTGQPHGLILAEAMRSGKTSVPPLERRTAPPGSICHTSRISVTVPAYRGFRGDLGGDLECDLVDRPRMVVVLAARPLSSALEERGLPGLAAV